MKVGSVPYLNAKPLIWGLHREPGVDLTFEVPSRLAVMLRNGELTAGMVSSVACFLNPQLWIAPGMSVASNGPVQSVKLFHNRGLESIRKVALDTSSLTSVLLSKVILSEAYGLTPEFVDMPPCVGDMLDSCDAAVMIGDPAMKVPSGRYPELDLGDEWHKLTGLPFVYAVWAVNPDLASAELVDILQRSKAYGIERFPEISESEAERLDLPYEVCFRYLSEIMNYDLTDCHMEGLNLFREKARQLGFVSGDHELRLYEG
jgi:chorismate dehydratase